MPPKAKVSERAQKELAAQRARAQALQYLQATGSGPNQRELEAERQWRQQLTNPMSAAANRRVAGSMPAQQQTAGGLDPRIRDNTLQALARSRASEIHAQQVTSAQYRSGTGWWRGDATLPNGWQEATDPATGDKYFWNEHTKETSWEHPGRAEAQPAVADSAGDEKEPELPANWEYVKDPQSGDTYYWNSVTNETTWTRPADTSVSLQHAREAKSKLDSILKSVDTGTRQAAADAKSPAPGRSDRSPGPSKPRHIMENGSATATNTSAQQVASSTHAPPSLVAAGIKRDTNAVTIDRPTNGSRATAEPDTKRRKVKPTEIDPMDPTGTGGKWSDGLDP